MTWALPSIEQSPRPDGSPSWEGGSRAEEHREFAQNHGESSGETPLSDHEDGLSVLPGLVDTIGDFAAPVLGSEVFPEIGWPERRVELAPGDALSAMGQVAVAHGYLWVELGAPGPEYRGRLGLFMEEAIEAALEARGALSPGIQASTGLDASLSDQLYRARLLEQQGIALGVPRLDGIANLGRTLDADDSAVLRWWMAAAAERPVWLVIDQRNVTLRVYPSPVLFETLFDVAPASPTPRPASLGMAESAMTMALSELPPEVAVAPVSEAPVSAAEPIAGDAHRADAPIADELGSADATDVEDVPVDALSELALARMTVPASSDEMRASDAGDDAPFEEEADWQSDDVELPDLDRALGLPPAPTPASAFGGPSPIDSIRAAESRLWLRARDEESELPPLPALASSASVVASEASKPALLPREAGASSLEADEFVRVLEEESRAAGEVLSVPAPLVSAFESADASEAMSAEPPEAEPAHTEPTPLPTKRISKQLFLRLADEQPGGALVAEAVPDLRPSEALPKPGATSRTPELAASDLVTGSPEAADVECTEPSEVAAASRELLRGESTPGQNAGADEPSVDAAPPFDLDDPFSRLAQREWRAWQTNLEAARGPRPLAAVERMFVTDYTRLREACRRGIADDGARKAADEWQTSFAQSYHDAFDALRVRGKRPNMVLDLPEMAQRLGRLQAARRVQLLLVDGLRFDLGLMVQERLKTMVDAALTERLLLWSALPSTTENQLELLGKGPEGLKDAPTTEEPPALVARGRAAESPRRVRVGRTELFKLDTVEDALRTTGKPVAARLGEIADVTATSLADHFSKQPPRTLVVVFGDHGFCLDPKKAGTAEEVRQGGATPEEVLVPAFAWLTGAVH